MWREILSGVLIVVGLFILSVSVYGMLKMPDIYTSIHAASKAAFLGIMPFLISAMLNGNPAVITRALLIAAFLILTTPISAHIIGQAAYLTREPMETEGAIDESGREGSAESAVTKAGD
ncbi:MAG TPA: monovalent cation/H(+) antiporter subunit G [Thermomicrobiales bacterium]|jgi:multicomponent Na+:H+ antiporter subunit G